MSLKDEQKEMWEELIDLPEDELLVKLEQIIESIEEEEKQEKDKNTLSFEEKNFEDICSSLTKLTKGKTWIWVPIKDQLGRLIYEERTELADCTSKEFKTWVEHVYPLAQNFLHSESDYENLSSKEKVFSAVVSLLSTGYKIPGASFIPK